MKYRLYFSVVEWKVVKHYFRKHFEPTSTWLMEDHSCVISVNNEHLLMKMIHVISEVLEVACNIYIDCPQCKGSGDLNCANKECDDGDHKIKEYASSNFAE